MSKRLAEEMCDAWSSRTGIPSVVLRPVLILDDLGLSRVSQREAEFGAFVHVEDVAEATALALEVDLPRHSRLTLCGPGAFDTAAASKLLGWHPAGAGRAATRLNAAERSGQNRALLWPTR